MLNRFGIEIFRGLGILRPLLHRLTDQAGIFKHATEIDVAGSELRIGL